MSMYYVATGRQHKEKTFLSEKKKISIIQEIFLVRKYILCRQRYYKKMEEYKTGW